MLDVSERAKEHSAIPRSSLRRLDQRRDSFPGGWAVNGCFSVVGSILAVAISMKLAFNAVLLIAAVVYAAGIWALRREGRAASSSFACRAKPT